MADTKISALTDLAAEPASDDKFVIVDTSAVETKRVDWSVLKAIFALAAKGVTNGDSHDHSGGDGAQIAHTALSAIGTNAHSVIDTFIASKAAASGLASLDGSSKVVQDPANATATATASKIPIADGSAHLDTWISAASETTAGKVELATTAEINTGTDAARAISPDALAGSYAGSKNVFLMISDPSTTPTTGDGKVHFMVPPELNGMNLVDADGVVTTVSSSGTPTIALRRERSGSAVDMLSTNITIDANEKTSYTAVTAPVINGTNDDVATGDIIYADLDTVGTGAKGHGAVLTFRLP